MTEPEFGRKEIYPDICVCCGRPVPEGRMICWNCEQGIDGHKSINRNVGDVEIRE